jgi:hypothetical protein
MNLLLIGPVQRVCGAVVLWSMVTPDSSRSFAKGAFYHAFTPEVNPFWSRACGETAVDFYWYGRTIYHRLALNGFISSHWNCTRRFPEV